MVGIYHKFNNLKKNNNSNAITLKLVKGFYVNNDNIIVKYKLGDTHLINIYDLLSGNQIKKIELLK